MDAKIGDNHLKDMLFRGVFLVLLVYILVFLYNNGTLNKLRRVPAPAPTSTPSAVANPQPVEDSTSESSESNNYYEYVEE